MLMGGVCDKVDGEIVVESKERLKRKGPKARTYFSSNAW